MRAEYSPARSAPRHRMKLGVEFGREVGTTRDVSTSGVYFNTTQSVVVGAEIRFALVIPDALKIDCHGIVVRVETQGLAATIDRIESIRPVPSRGPDA